jgi:hypothetical protein
MISTWTCEWCGTAHYNPDDYLACTARHKPQYLDMDEEGLRNTLRVREIEITELRTQHAEDVALLLEVISPMRLSYDQHDLNTRIRTRLEKE